MSIKAKALVYGHNIDTDRIIPGKYTKTLDMQSLAEHVMEDVDDKFYSHFSVGDIIVAGDNFGCGSSREQAPIALKVAGASCIIANYFARIFFRNAINIGLPVLEIANHHIKMYDELSIDLEHGIVKNHTQKCSYQATKMPAIMLQIMQEGGLVPYLKLHGNYKVEV